MNYTPEQLAELSQWERNFTTAVEGNWTPRLSIPSQKRIRAIYEAATKTRIAFNIGCGHCVLNLLKQAGKLYFADKAEMEKKVADAKQAQTETPASPEKPVESVQKLDSADAKPKVKKSTASKPKGEKTATSAKPKTSKKKA